MIVVYIVWFVLSVFHSYHAHVRLVLGNASALLLRLWNLLDVYVCLVLWLDWYIFAAVKHGEEISLS